VFSDPRPLPFVGLVLLLSLTACSERGAAEAVQAERPPPVEPSAELPDLSALLVTAREAAASRATALGVHTLVTETVKAREFDSPVTYRTTVVRGAAASDLRVEFDLRDRVTSHCLYREIVSGGTTNAWFLAGHHLQFGRKKVVSGLLQFERWFEHPALQATRARVAGEVTEGGRPALLVEVPSQVAADRHCFVCDTDVRRADLAVWMERGGLELVKAVAAKGSAEMTGPEMGRWWRQAGDDELIHRAWVSPDPKHLEAVAEHVPLVEGLTRDKTHIFDVENPFETFSRLWIDRETGLLLRAEGALADRNKGGGKSTAATWGEFREVTPGVSLPHRMELSVGDELFSTTSVVSVEPNHGTIATDVVAVHAALEVLAQTQNEQQYRELIAQADIKQAEPDPARDEVFSPGKLLRELRIEPGDEVADIGAGTGYFTTHLALAAGPEGRVYATDINPTIVDYLRQRLSSSELNPHGNVEYVVNDFDDLGLPDATLDLAFLAGVGLGRFMTPSETNQTMIGSIFAAVRPGGRLAVIENRTQGSRVTAVSLGLAMVDFDVEDPRWMALHWPGRPARQGFLDEILVHSFEAAGFRYSRSSDLIEGQAFLFFDKPR